MIKLSNWSLTYHAEVRLQKRSYQFIVNEIAWMMRTSVLGTQSVLFVVLILGIVETVANTAKLKRAK